MEFFDQVCIDVRTGDIMNPLLPEDAQSNLILASSSPRRKEILQKLGFEFEVIPADIDEDFLDGEDFVSHAERLALSKAVKIRGLRPEGKIIICGILREPNYDLLKRSNTVKEGFYAINEKVHSMRFKTEKSRCRECEFRQIC